MEMKNKKLYLTIVGVLLLVFIIIGATYAYFSAEVKNVNNTETHIKTNELGLAFTGETEISCTSMVPGNTCTKTFKVQNTSNVKTTYNIYMENITNEFNEDLVYTLTDDEGTVVAQTALPETGTRKTYLKTGIEIDPTPATKNYTLTIEFKYSNENQNAYQGAEFKATVGIDADQTLTTNSSKLCKRATDLHTKDSYTYGSSGTPGTLASGDAYDCDVDGNGTYDEDERFYYVTDYYDTTTGEFDEDTAVLIYYSNTLNGIANSDKYENHIAYYVNSENSGYENWNGPLVAMTNLPTTSQWKNVRLKQNIRKLINEVGGDSIFIYPDTMSYVQVNYTGYAARLLTMQELKKAKNIEDINTNSFVYANSSDYYLIENTKYFDSNFICGYWLENPHSRQQSSAWRANAEYLELAGVSGISDDYLGTRPVIDVPKTDMEI